MVRYNKNEKRLNNGITEFIDTSSINLAIHNNITKSYETKSGEIIYSNLEEDNKL